MRKFTVPLWIFLLLVTIGCSGSGGENPIQAPQKSLRTLELGNGHTSLGFYNLIIDVERGEVTSVENRIISPHVNVTGWLVDPACPGGICLQFVVNGYDPNENVLSLVIQLMNPTNLSPWDPRIILFTSPYPEDYDVRNADSWTTLFDPDTEFPDFVNPFIALAKDELNNRRLPPNPMWTYEELELYMNPIPIDPDAELLYSVEVSWPGRCREPYDISNIQFLYDDPLNPVGYEGGLNSTAFPDVDAFTIACDVYDWQNDLFEVSFYAPDILLDTDWHAMAPDLDGPSERWFATFTDISDVPEDWYETWFRAESNAPTDQVAHIYQRFQFPVHEFDPGGLNGSSGEGKTPKFVFLRDNGGYSDIVIKEVVGGGGETTMFTGEPAWENSEEFSPSLGRHEVGNICLFASQTDGPTDIWIATLDSNFSQQLTDDEFADYGPQMNPLYPGTPAYPTDDTVDFVFYSDREDGNAEIYAYDFEASGPPIKRLTFDWGHDYDPCIYSVPGTGQTFVAFASNRNGYDNYDIYVLDTSTMAYPYRITWSTSNDMHPTWASNRPLDGVEIAFTTNRNGDYDIYKWVYATRKVHQIVADAGDQIDPHFSPNGGQIIYSSKDNEHYNIWTIAADGNPDFKFKRTFTSKHEWAPFWGWAN